MRTPAQRSAGFTLFEVILASTIFVLLAGGIFFSVSTSMSAADELGRQQIEVRQGSAFIRFLRKGFLNLPVEAEIAVSTRTSGASGDAVDLIIRRAPGAFETGALEAQGGGIVLSTMPDGRGKSTFSLIRFPDKLGESDLTRYLDSVTWLPLLDNVEKLRWRFWDGDRREFVELWERKDTHPELIELTLQRAGDGEQTSFFRLPRLVAQKAPTPEPSPTPGEQAP